MFPKKSGLGPLPESRPRLKPVCFAHALMARLKACPDTSKSKSQISKAFHNCIRKQVFPQPLNAWLIRAKIFHQPDETAPWHGQLARVPQVRVRSLDANLGIPSADVFNDPQHGPKFKTRYLTLARCLSSPNRIRVCGPRAMHLASHRALGQAPSDSSRT